MSLDVLRRVTPWTGMRGSAPGEGREYVKIYPSERELGNNEENNAHV